MDKVRMEKLLNTLLTRRMRSAYAVVGTASLMAMTCLAIYGLFHIGCNDQYLSDGEVPQMHDSIPKTIGTERLSLEDIRKVGNLPEQAVLFMHDTLSGIVHLNDRTIRAIRLSAINSKPHANYIGKSYFTASEQDLHTLAQVLSELMDRPLTELDSLNPSDRYKWSRDFKDFTLRVGEGEVKHSSLPLYNLFLTELIERSLPLGSMLALVPGGVDTLAPQGARMWADYLVEAEVTVPHNDDLSGRVELLLANANKLKGQHEELKASANRYASFLRRTLISFILLSLVTMSFLIPVLIRDMRGLHSNNEKDTPDSLVIVPDGSANLEEATMDEANSEENKGSKKRIQELTAEKEKLKVIEEELKKCKENENELQSTLDSMLTKLASTENSLTESKKLNKEFESLSAIDTYSKLINLQPVALRERISGLIGFCEELHADSQAYRKIRNRVGHDVKSAKPLDFAEEFISVSGSDDVKALLKWVAFPNHQMIATKLDFCEKVGHLFEGLGTESKPADHLKVLKSLRDHVIEDLRIPSAQLFYRFFRFHPFFVHINTSQGEKNLKRLISDWVQSTGDSKAVEKQDERFAEAHLEKERVFQRYKKVRSHLHAHFERVRGDEQKIWGLRNETDRDTFVRLLLSSFLFSTSVAALLDKGSEEALSEEHRNNLLILGKQGEARNLGEPYRFDHRTTPAFQRQFFFHMDLLGIDRFDDALVDGCYLDPEK